ncbi:MAG: rhamnosyl/mannosyltransferase [Alcanivorax sp.]|jgi:rhamnosyl/mannosyltransferase
MKVLHVGKYFPPYAGGMENYQRDLMVALKKIGIENSALVHQSNLGVRSGEETFKAGGEELRITRAAVWARLLFTPISPTFGLLLNRAIKDEKPDILHLHMPNVSAFWALLLPRARAIPWVVQWQSDVVASQYSIGLRLFYRLYQPFERALLKRSSAIIAASPPYLETSKPLNDFREKCTVIPLGLDPGSADRTPSDNSDHGNSTQLQVLAIGRLSYYKGFDILIRALAKMPDASLSLVGIGDQESQLKALVKQLGIEQQVCFKGKLSPEQLEREFTTCDCLCLPSLERTEAFGMVLIEAMHHGKATVVSDIAGSGVTWVVQTGVTGLTVPPGDATSLANALLELHRDRDKMARFGEQGRHRFDNLFHIHQSATAVAELYKDVTCSA